MSNGSRNKYMYPWDLKYQHVSGKNPLIKMKGVEWRYDLLRSSRDSCTYIETINSGMVEKKPVPRENTLTFSQ